MVRSALCAFRTMLRIAGRTMRPETLAILRDAGLRPLRMRASARPVGAGDGVALQRRNFAGPEAFGDAGEACLIQLPVDPLGRLVRPTDHGEPTQGACKCDQRRHRSILVLHVSAPDSHSLPRRPRSQSGWPGTKWR